MGGVNNDTPVLRMSCCPIRRLAAWNPASRGLAGAGTTLYRGSIRRQLRRLGRIDLNKSFIRDYQPRVGVR